MTRTIANTESPVDTGHKILAKVSGQNPEHVGVAVSGGDDSITALHFAHNSPEIEIDFVVHIDTGIGIQETQEFVKRECEKLGVELYILGDDNARLGHETYRSLVRRFGFPGANPIAHRNMWRNLKDKLTARFESQLDGDLTLISGVRKFESELRYERLSDNAIQSIRGITWASPLVEFTDEDLRKYRSNHEISENLVAELLCASGECLCGAYADRRNLPLIEEYYPETARQIYQLEWEALERAARGEFPVRWALWAHGSVDAGEYSARTDDKQQRITCSDCEDKCPNNPYELAGKPLSPAEKFLRENDLSDFWNHLFFCIPCCTVVEDPLEHRRDVHPHDADESNSLATAWDMRRIVPSESHRRGQPITEPDGWNLHPGQLTRDQSAAEGRKHIYYYENVSLAHCSEEHEWNPWHAGLEKCSECFAINLSNYNPSNPSPPSIDCNASDNSNHCNAEAQRVHKILSEFQ